MTERQYVQHNLEVYSCVIKKKHVAFAKKHVVFDSFNQLSTNGNLAILFQRFSKLKHDTILHTNFQSKL
jgi:hypothetical protein